MKRQLRDITINFLKNIDPEQFKKQKVFILALQDYLKFNELSKEREMADGILTLLTNLTDFLVSAGFQNATLEVGEYYEIGREFFKKVQ